MGVSKELLDILVCPKCKEKLIISDDGLQLICNNCLLAYPIKNDIPVMLIEYAKPINNQQEQ